MKTNPECPSCKYQNKEQFRHCPNCKFPLMLIANKYRIERQIDEGGMGTVYLVHHTGLNYDTGRVAKVIKESVITSKNVKKRFQREVQITAALSQQNEHIVRIYDDFGEEPGLGHYYVMEYLQGLPLGKTIKPGQGVPLPTALHIFYQTSKALVQAHENNVVHRDLKPDNIFLIKRGTDQHFVKLLDFGIAKPEKADTKLTQGIMGTPLYMSPEQCKATDIDNRSDIYSMGIILYEMLSGRMPYGVGSEESPFTILAAHLKRKPIPIQRLVPELAWFDPILQKALEKEPEDRFKTMRDFWEAIQDAAPSTLHLPGFDAASITVSEQELPAATIVAEEGLAGPGPKTTHEGPTTFELQRKRSTWLSLSVLLMLLPLVGWGLYGLLENTKAPAVKDAGAPKATPARILAVPDKKNPFEPIVTPDVAPNKAPDTTSPREIPEAPPVRRTEPRKKNRRRLVRRRRRRRKTRSLRARRVRLRRPVRRKKPRHRCGALPAGRRWVFARLRTPSSGKIGLSFLNCRACKWSRRAGGYCLQLPNKRVSAKVRLYGYQTCRFAIPTTTRRFGWKLKLEAPNELAFEGYRCLTR